MTALFAAKYAALSFYFYYGQHTLLEPITRLESPAYASPVLEGRLVLARGMVSADHPLSDPQYGITAKAVRMKRHVSGIPRAEGEALCPAPSDPPERFLSNWYACAPVHLGGYRLQGPGLYAMRLLYAERPVLSVMSLPAEIRNLAEIDQQSIIIPSANGFKYRVKFTIAKEGPAAFLGRQRGDTLLSDATTTWRMGFMENHSQQGLALSLMNAGFFLLLSWAAMVLALYSLLQAVQSRMNLPEMAWYALLLSLISGLGLYGIMIDNGVLRSNPSLYRVWFRHEPYAFEPGQLQPELAAAAHVCLWIGMGLCVALALLPATRRLLRRLSRAKKR